MDITYIPMARGFVYLAAVLDWATRRVLLTACRSRWTPSSASKRWRRPWLATAPEIFNTDQGSQFTSAEFTGMLKKRGIGISMDGKGAWRDNVFVERLWRSVKYEEVYLKAYDTVSAARAGLARYLDFYNPRRPHSSLDGKTPDAVYFASLPATRKAA